MGKSANDAVSMDVLVLVLLLKELKRGEYASSMEAKLKRYSFERR